jgi:ectoine hydroxylase-related dioxygenase (phytanoyl-CoA dioxygenase family)
MSVSTVDALHLDRHELATYDTRGYTVAPGLATESFLDRAQELLESLVDESIEAWRRDGCIRETSRSLGFADRYHHAWVMAGRPPVRTTMDPRFSGEAIADLMSDDRLVDCASVLLGCDEVRMLDSCNYRAKFPGDTSTNHPWHQDAQCLRPISGIDFVTAWIPLADVAVESSCLWVAPNPERVVCTPVYSPVIDYTCMQDSDVTALRTVEPVEMHRGDVLFMSPFLPHRSLTNTTRHIRWSVDFRYAHPRSQPE